MSRDDFLSLIRPFIRFKDFQNHSQRPLFIINLSPPQGFPFYDKPMRIAYSKTDSDVIAKMKGTFTERPKRAPGESKKAKKRAAKEAAARQGAAAAAGGGGSAAAAANGAAGQPGGHVPDAPPNQV